jgi:hypothetical protein
VGGEPLCDCHVDADCAPREDGDRCNGLLVCDTDGFPARCVVDPGTVITCGPPPDACRTVACQPGSGECVVANAIDGTPCDDGDACTGGDACQTGACVPGAEPLCPCPPDMVPVAGAFCLDRYEASRPDASATGVGADGSKATSRAGVLPWFPVDRALALAACTAAGKRLCTAVEVQGACQGTAGTTYTYGDAYDADVCNGIDAFCDCTHPNCAALAECPYPHCRSYSPEGIYGSGCGSAFHVVPTGAFPACVSADGAFDLNGNVWELVDVGTTASWYKGGAYNCSDSELLHRCDGMYQEISAKGFRCCRDLGAGVP